MRTFIKKFKNSILGKILKFIFKLIKWALELTVITIAIIIIVQRVSDNRKSFLGYRIFNVASGSMEPEYAVGDILIAKKKDPSTIKVGDNIVYLGNKSDYKGKIITHAVIAIDENDNGEYLFHTKGKANTIEDPVVHQNQLYGVVVNNNVVLAFLCKILTNKYGLYFLVIVPIVLYAFIEFVKVQGRRIEQEREEEAKQKEIEKQKELEEAKQKEVVETKTKQSRKSKKTVEEKAKEIAEKNEDTEKVEVQKSKRTRKTKTSVNSEEQKD